MPILPDWLIQVLQVLAVLLLGPLVTGVIAPAVSVSYRRHHEPRR